MSEKLQNHQIRVKNRAGRSLPVCSVLGFPASILEEMLSGRAEGVADKSPSMYKMCIPRGFTSFASWFTWFLGLASLSIINTVTSEIFHFQPLISSCDSSWSSVDSLAPFAVTATMLPCLISRLQSDELKVQTHRGLYRQLDVAELISSVPLLDSAERAEAIKRTK